MEVEPDTGVLETRPEEELEVSVTSDIAEEKDQVSRALAGQDQEEAAQQAQDTDEDEEAAEDAQLQEGPEPEDEPREAKEDETEEAPQASSSSSARYGLRRRAEATPLALELDDGEIRGFGRGRSWASHRAKPVRRGGGKPTPQPAKPAAPLERTEDGEYQCSSCPKSFASSSRLKIHVYQRHGQQLTPVCELCSMQFNTTSALASHRARKHPAEAKEPRPPPAEGISCGLCDLASFPTTTDLCQHLSRRHGQPAVVADKEFPNFPAFEAWIEEVERRDQCKFRKRTGAKKRGVGNKVHYFVCHRSGVPKLIPRDQKKADRADRESKKIGFTCSAFINVMEVRGQRDTKSCVRIKYCTDHYGHAPGTRFAPGLKRGLVRSRLPADPAGEEDEDEEEEEEDAAPEPSPPKQPRPSSEAANRRRVYQLLASLKASVDLLGDETRLSALAAGLRGLLDVAKGNGPLLDDSPVKETSVAPPPPPSPLPPPTRRPQQPRTVEHQYHQPLPPPPPPQPLPPPARVHGLHLGPAQLAPAQISSAQITSAQLTSGQLAPGHLLVDRARVVQPPQPTHVLVHHPEHQQRIVLHPPQPQPRAPQKIFSIPAFPQHSQQ